LHTKSAEIACKKKLFAFDTIPFTLREKNFEMFLEFKFLGENFLMLRGIYRTKRDGYTMRRSIFVGTNVSNYLFSKFGTPQKYNFQSPKTIETHENIKNRAIKCFQVPPEQRESVFGTSKCLHRV